MDPLTGALTFSTIVGLLSNFKGERSSREMGEFIHWLKEKHHNDVVDQLEGNQALLGEVAGLLSTNHGELVSRLNELDRIMSSVAARIDGFTGVAVAVYPEEELSEQAVSVLRQLVESGAKYFLHLPEMNGGEPDGYHLFEGAHGQIKYSEPRFMEDDLLTLVSYGLLNHEYTNQGNSKYSVTRAAVGYIEAMH